MKRQRVINYGVTKEAGSPPPPKKLALASPSAPTVPTPKPVFKSESLPSKPAVPSNKLPLSKSPQQASSSSPSNEEEGEEIVYAVLWTTRSGKMHKVYDNGTIRVQGKRCNLFDAQGKQVGTTIMHSETKLATLKEDDDLVVGDKELKVQERITKQDAKQMATSTKMAVDKEPPKAPKVVKTGTLPTSSNAPLRTIKANTKLFNAVDENAFVLNEGSSTSGGTEGKVVLESFLRQKMRPHQLDGVRFLYECVTGMRSHPGGATTGCILADVMGLGKTFQTIALLRVLSTPSPSAEPLVRKALVIVPTSLVAPWAKEVEKWLGGERMKPLAIAERSKSETIKEITTFKDSVNQKLLIISYDQVRIHVELLQKIKFGIVICDEGHRLKNPASKISTSIASLDVPRRVILTGTPFQNNLAEYFALVDFVNPGALDTIDSFKRNFEKPIALSRLPGATPSCREAGAKKSRELLDLTSAIILRRTSKVLEAFLPQKHEIVVFCKPSSEQVACYKAVLESIGAPIAEGDDDDIALEEDATLDLNGANSLAVMLQLSKVCNHPTLLLPRHQHEELSALQQQVSDIIVNGDSGPHDSSLSGKMLVLERLLDATRRKTKDKMVIVSSFTKTLDLLQELAKKKNFSFLRLDGSVDLAHRNHAVEQFQRDPNVFLFLLSTKAGGVGLNLFAANRLVLFDSCWNPAFDTQAQARVWRDGQTKPTFIYRFLATGMLDEKIFQRQLVKNDMGRAVLDDEGAEEADAEAADTKKSKNQEEGKKLTSAMLSVSSFTPEDLKDIFSYNSRSICDTHDISGCTCLHGASSKGSDSKTKTIKLTKDEISDYAHLEHVKDSEDPVLATPGVADGLVSFLFTKSTHPIAS